MQDFLGVIPNPAISDDFFYNARFLYNLFYKEFIK